MTIFKTSPSISIDRAVKMILADPTILGAGWRLLSHGHATPAEATELLLATPSGKLVICLAAKEVDTSLLTRGLTLLGQARQALPLLQTFPLAGANGRAGSKLLLLGGTVKPEALYLAGAEVSIRMLAEVPGQPGKSSLRHVVPRCARPESLYHAKGIPSGLKATLPEW